MRGIGRPASIVAVSALTALLLAHAAQAGFAANSSTILSVNAAQALTSQCSRRSPGPVASLWTPTQEQIADLESRLEPLLSQRLEANGIAPTDMAADDYYRQYAGFVINGRRVIYVNGVYKSAVGADVPATRMDWRKQAIRICDGGPITFGVEYDVETHTLSNFDFNGQA